MEEMWRKIKRFNDYEVSNLGRVRSNKLGKKGAILKPRKQTGDKPYAMVYLLGNDGKYRLVRIHRLVALAFCTKPSKCNIVNHIDGNKTNNVATNLEWTNHSGNNKHAYKNDLRKKPSGIGKQVAQILSNGDEIIYSSITSAAKAVGISDSAIGKVCRNLQNTAGGFIWKYVD